MLSITKSNICSLITEKLFSHVDNDLVKWDVFFQVKAGIVVNFGSVLILVICTNILMYPVFDLGNFPEEFLNATKAFSEVVMHSNETLGYNVTSGT